MLVWLLAADLAAACLLGVVVYVVGRRVRPPVPVRSALLIAAYFALLTLAAYGLMVLIVA